MTKHWLLRVWYPLVLITHLLYFSQFILHAYFICTYRRLMNVICYLIIVKKTHLHNLIICKYIINKQTRIIVNSRSQQSLQKSQMSKKKTHYLPDHLVLRVKNNCLKRYNNIFLFIKNFYFFNPSCVLWKKNIILI